MEAFIIADHVIAKTHFEPSSKPHFKYLKKYDLPPKINPSIVESSPKKHNQKYNFLSYHQPVIKTKKLLSALTNSIGDHPFKNINQNQIEFNKSFFTQNTKNKGAQRIRKSKLNLLIRKIEPERQQYNVNFNPIKKSPPSWTFVPQRNKTAQFIRRKTDDRHNRQSSRDYIKDCIWKTINRELSDGEEAIIQKIEKQIYQQMKEKTGIGKRQSQSKLQYYPEELFNSTSEIFKKYHLDRDNHFQKFLQNIKNQQPKPHKYS